MGNIMSNEAQIMEIKADAVETIALPVYIPTIEETFKASGAHRQAVSAL